MNLVWIHRQGVSKYGDVLDRHYLTDELSHLVLGHVDPPEYPCLCYSAFLYSGSTTVEYTDLETAKAFLEAKALMKKESDEYSQEVLEKQHSEVK